MLLKNSKKNFTAVLSSFARLILFLSISLSRISAESAADSRVSYLIDRFSVIGVDESISETTIKYRGKHKARELLGSSQSHIERLSVFLPVLGELVFHSRSFDVLSSETISDIDALRVWSGDLKDKSEGNIVQYTGDANFILLPSGGLACRIQVGSSLYQCKKCNSEYSLLERSESEDCIELHEIDSNTQDKYTRSVHQSNKFSRSSNSGGNLNATSKIRNTRRSNRSLADDGTVIDVLMMYNEQTIAEYKSEIDFMAEVSLYISQNNKIFFNSGIDLKLQVVGWLDLDFADSHDGYKTLTHISDNTRVDIERDRTGADLVIFFSSASDQCVNVWFPNPISVLDKEHVFSVVRTSCLGNGSLYWAIGAQFGCAVNYEESSKDRVIPYAYGYQSKNCEFQTIMSNACNSSIQIPYYSNPNFKWIATGEAIGSVDSANCAKVISDYKSIISQYRKSVQTPAKLQTVSPIQRYFPAPTPALVEEIFVSETANQMTGSVTFINSAQQNTVEGSYDSDLFYDVSLISSFSDLMYFDHAMGLFFMSVFEKVVTSPLNLGDPQYVSYQKDFEIIDERKLMTAIPVIDVSFEVKAVPGDVVDKLLDTLESSSAKLVLIEKLQASSDFSGISDIKFQLDGDIEAESNSVFQAFVALIMLLTSSILFKVAIGVCILLYVLSKKDCCKKQSNETSQHRSQTTETNYRSTEAITATPVNEEPLRYEIVREEEQCLTFFSNVRVPKIKNFQLKVVQLPLNEALQSMCDDLRNIYAPIMLRHRNAKEMVNWTKKVKGRLSEPSTLISQRRRRFESVDVNQMVGVKDCLEGLLRTSFEKNLAGELLSYLSTAEMVQTVRHASNSIDDALSSFNSQHTVSRDRDLKMGKR